MKKWRHVESEEDVGNEEDLKHVESEDILKMKMWRHVENKEMETWLGMRKIWNTLKMKSWRHVENEERKKMVESVDGKPG